MRNLTERVTAYERQPCRACEEDLNVGASLPSIYFKLKVLLIDFPYPYIKSFANNDAASPTTLLQAHPLIYSYTVSYMPVSCNLLYLRSQLAKHMLLQCS